MREVDIGVNLYFVPFSNAVAGGGPFDRDGRTDGGGEQLPSRYLH